jgi:uncharacterized protein (TIGR03437 family)
VTVNAPDGCLWSAISNDAFLSITDGTNGSGTGTVEYAVTANTDNSERTGSLTIADQTFTITQAGLGCDYSIDPTSQSFDAQGGSGNLTVSALENCSWTAESNSDFLTITAGASGSGNGTVEFFLDTNPNPDGRTGELLVAGLTFIATQTGTTPPPPAPVVNEGGVVNYASFTPSPAPVAPGSIAAVQGQNLNNGPQLLFASLGKDGKLPTNLGGSRVTFNGILSPIFFATPGQLGVQIPLGLSGESSVTVVVTVGGQSSAPRTVNLADYAPGIFTQNQQGTGTAIALHEDGRTLVTPENPAHPDEVITFFLTGLGPLSPPLETGTPAQANQTVEPSTVSLDGGSADVEFSGSAPGSVGLNKVTVRIPTGTRTAPDIPVVLTIGGRTSNITTIPVGP